MSSKVALKIDNVSKCYQIYDKPRDRLMQMLAGKRKQYFREFWALRNISFEVQKGETVGIVGRNGSGKSTLLQMICGTLNPSDGQITTNGRIAALLELGSGFNPDFTGTENVYLNAAVLGLTHSEISERFAKIEEFADIGDFISQPVKSYSSGMLVRLAFAVQAMVEPDILIVDEALAVGDEKFQRKCFARLEELKSKGTSILFVSHSGPQVVELCDRAILLDYGTMLMEDAPAKVIRDYQRLIYAPKAEYPALLSGLINDSAIHSDVDEGQNPEEKPSVFTEHESVFKTSFDKSLTPETTTVYPEQGAVISAISISDNASKTVNILQAHEQYTFHIDGRFHLPFPKIHFGIHIKSISGAVITGQRYPPEGESFSAPEGGRFRVSFHFNMMLLPGTYFIGGGIWSDTDGSCAHRIIDALMFRVESGDAHISFGYCDLAAAKADVEIMRDH